MKPLNRAERNSAFLRFLLLFLVTIAVMVTVIFFSFEVPVRENEQLRQTILAIQKEKALTAPFNVAMKVAMEELYNYNQAIDNPTAKKLRVKLKIKEMEDLLGQIPPDESNLYNLIVQNLTDLNEAKAKLRIAKYE
jgi:hypothetical protein